MRRGVVVAGLVAQLCLFGQVNVSMAAPQASLEASPDGTLRVVGDGWRPGDQLALIFGQHRFEAFVDSAGGFEVTTGLPQLQGALAVHHVARMEATTFTTPQVHPLAVWFAQSLLLGCTYAGVLVSLAVGFFAVARQVLKRRYAARHDNWPRGLARPAERP